MNDGSRPFNNEQIRQLSRAFHQGAAESSAALKVWLSVGTKVSIDAVEQCPLEEVTSVLDTTEEAICMCVMEMQGTLTGQMLLAFDDAVGLALADLVIGRPLGTSHEWNDLEISSALETMNIAGSAYLNGIARDLSQRTGEAISLMPLPPVFLRDFRESLLETVFIDQAVTGRYAVFAKAAFELEGNPLLWKFLLVPDADSLARMAEILSRLA